MKTFKPMRAGKALKDYTQLNYPLLASPKLDGIRCVIHKGEAMSKTLHTIPNKGVSDLLRDLPEGLDGELILDSGDFNDCSSFFMSKDKPHQPFAFHVFDCDDDFDGVDRLGFAARLRMTEKWVKKVGLDYVRFVEHRVIDDAEALTRYVHECMSQGLEGVMIREPNGPYKYGTSTLKEGFLLKVKPTEDEEATITGVVERLTNNNPKTKDAFGNSKRSSHKAGKVPAGDAGKFLCVTHDGIEFALGIKPKHRAEYWERQDELIGTLVKFQYQPHPDGRFGGGDAKPRSPIFLGLRHEEDQ